MSEAALLPKVNGKRSVALAEQLLSGNTSQDIYWSSRPGSKESRLPAVDLLLKDLDGVLTGWRQFKLGSAHSQLRFKEAIQNFDRIRRQFDSKLFFLVVFGPLKAGKSTLTNILAGEFVSPTGFGKETTVRPSLIVQGKESQIEQYFSNNPEVNHFLRQHKGRGGAPASTSAENQEHALKKTRECFDSVADYIRGIRGLGELERQIRMESHPLNAISLERTLTAELPVEPLITVIRCKGGYLLGEGVAIVDMPGLDGSKSNWRDDPLHEWVMHRAEFFLFVQSSIAALNGQTHDFLKEVIAQSTKPPFWLVQNMFDARSWQPEEKRQKDHLEQREDGRRRIEEILGEKPRSVAGLNLGLAWDGVHEGQNEWLSKSGFPAFEAELAKILCSERAAIQEKNCLLGLEAELKEKEEMLKSVAEEILQTRSRHAAMREDLGKAKTLLAEMDYRGDWEEPTQSAFTRIADDCAKAWEDEMECKVASLIDRLNRKCSFHEVDEQIRVAATQLGEAGHHTFDPAPLVPRYAKLAAQFCKEPEQRAIEQCMQLLLGHGTIEPSAPKNPSLDQLPTIPSDSFEAGPLERGFWDRLLPWIAKSNGDHNTDHLKAVAKRWRNQLQQRKSTWLKEWIHRHFDTYCESRRRHYQEWASKAEAKLEAQAAIEEKAMAEAETICEQMATDLKAIKARLIQALASV